MDYKQLGIRIRQERLRLNLTQEQLSEYIGISTAYLGQIERGDRNVTLDKLIPIANRLGVTIDYLLTDYINEHNIDINLKRLSQLFDGKSEAEKEMAVNMIKMLFSYTDELKKH